MSFSADNLTIGRGNFNNYASINSPAQHIYSSSDTLEMISQLGYFPPYLGTFSKSSDNTSIQVNDILTVISTSDNTTVDYLINSLSPLVLNFEHSLDTYNNIPFIGASAGPGSLTFRFSRKNDRVYFDILETASLLASQRSGAYILNFNVPDHYRPNSLYNSGLGAGLIILPCPAANDSGALNIDINIGGSIEIFKLPDALFDLNENVALHHFSASYFGKPI